MNHASVYETHKNSVYNLALNYLGSKEDAEEITQDVFIKVFTKLDTFRHEAQLKTWIYRITINLCLDFLKAKKAQKRSSIFSILRIDDTNKRTEIPVFDHPGVALENKEAMAKLFALINELPENQKTALLLLKVEQVPPQECAEIMQLSLKAVDSLFQRAKKNLEKKIQDNEEKE